MSDTRRMDPISTLHGRVFDRRVRVLADVIAPLLPDGARVLDVGCGDGAIALNIMKRRPDVEIRGLDVLVRPSTHIPAQEFDGIHLPAPDKSYDAVTFVDVLHHTDDPTVLLREAARVARSAVVIKDHEADRFLAHPTLRFIDWVGNARYGVRLPYNYWRADQWAASLDAAGLRLDREERDFPLYPFPASLLFGGRLQVVKVATPI